MSFFHGAHNVAINNSVFLGEYREPDHVGKGLEMLDKRAVFSAAYNSEARYPLPSCHRGTRSRVLNTLRNWIQDPTTRTKIYWLYGAVGVGKSAVAQTISQEFSASCLAASFFFSRTDPTRNNLSQFFVTLTQQLVTSPTKLKPLFRSFIDIAILCRRNILDIVLEDQFQELIVKPCSQLELSADQWKDLPCLIVIDGLDECTDTKSQERLISILRSQPSPFKFLICSRPEPCIRNAFRHRDFDSILDRIDVGDVPESEDDIFNFLQDGFTKIREEHEAMAHMDVDWPKDGVIQQLVERACRQFIYASTIIEYVGDSHSFPEDQLDIILNITVPEGYDSPYPDLDLLYTQILSSCNKERELSVDVLGYLLQPKVVFDHRPGNQFDKTASCYIEGLFLLRKGKVRSLFSGLHSVLLIPEREGDGIIVRHASFADFLTDRKRAKEFFVQGGHEPISICLLNRISLSIKKETWLSSNFDVYAWKFWYIHCSKVTESASTRFLTTLEHLDLCGLMHTALQGQDSLVGCVQALNKCLHSLNSIAEWAQNLNLLALSKQYRLFEQGFQLQIPSSFDAQNCQKLIITVSILSYYFILSGRNREEIISYLLSNHLNLSQVSRYLHSPWPCPRIRPLTNSNIFDYDTMPDQSADPLVHSDGHTVSIIFSQFHAKVWLKCLHFLRCPASYTHTMVDYANSNWIYHFLMIKSGSDGHSVLEELQMHLNSDLIQTLDDARKALDGIEISSLSVVMKFQVASILQNHMEVLLSKSLKGP